MSMIRRRLAEERGQALVEGLFALGLVLFVVAIAAETIGYVHTRNVAEAAAQDGARTAAIDGPQAGVERAQAVLAAAGGAGSGMHAAATVNGGEVTIEVDGQAPRLFALPFTLPAVSASASLPLEQYPNTGTEP